MDEFGIDTTMTRSHARYLKGERAESVEPFKPGKKISVIGALSLTGVGATISVEGLVDTEVFDAYVQHFLAPTLFKGDIVLLDNVKFHYSQR
ncbi:MAG: transposase, partial [Planctomyces sp.]